MWRVWPGVGWLEGGCCCEWVSERVLMMKKKTCADESLFIRLWGLKRMTCYWCNSNMHYAHHNLLHHHHSFLFFYSRVLWYLYLHRELCVGVECGEREVNETACWTLPLVRSLFSSTPLAVVSSWLVFVLYLSLPQNLKLFDFIESSFPVQMHQEQSSSHRYPC